MISLRWLLSLPLAAAVLVLPGTVLASVADLVSQVSEANLVAHVAALEGDRSTSAAQAVAAAYIRGELESYGYTVTSQAVAGSENLVATLVGAVAPDEEFVLGAHFDTVSGSPGADDNASSVAAVLEVARVLADETPGSTVHFVFFALEEFGYQGSEAYAAALAAQNADVVGMISLDMIGYTCSTPGCQAVLPDMPGCLVTSGLSDVGDFIGIGSNTASVPLLNAFMSNAAAHVPGLPLEYFTIEGTGTCFAQSRRSDHKSFWDEGYPAIILGDGAEARNPNYHQSTDTLATLDTAFMTSVTRAVLAHVATTALAPVAVPLLGPGGVALLTGGMLGMGLLALRRSRPARRRSARDGA
jgi:Zn-dependent M28 family amino/carboxypeptidase